MSNELVVLNNDALQTGGVGLGAAIFKARPQYLELVQKTTRQEGAIPGKFRNVNTGDHYDEMRIVLLGVPQEQREKYDNSGIFSKEHKDCFSLDNIQPHARAKNPPALYCATCPDGDVRWKKWRETHLAADLPPCSMFYKVFLADRTTQTPYFLALKGKSVMPFKAAMETQLAGLLQKVMADVRAKNKLRGYTYVPRTGLFVPTPDFPLAAGENRALPLPLPNIFDISFTIFVTTKEQGGVPVVGCKDFKLMAEADREEFGALYLELTKQRPDTSAAEEEAQQVAAAVSAPPAPAVVLPGPATVPTITTGINEGPLVGEVVGKDEPITI